MPNQEISLSQQLLDKAQEFAVQAGDRRLTDKKAIKIASQCIGTMLAQMDSESARLEYFRIQQNAMVVAAQIAKEKGAEDAAKFLLGHAVAASTLEDFAILKTTEPTEKRLDQLIAKHSLIDQIKKLDE